MTTVQLDNEEKTAIKNKAYAFKFSLFCSIIDHNPFFFNMYKLVIPVG